MMENIQIFRVIRSNSYTAMLSFVPLSLQFLNGWWGETWFRGRSHRMCSGAFYKRNAVHSFLKELYPIHRLSFFNAKLS
jgi:hypothetical protein